MGDAIYHLLNTYEFLIGFIAGGTLWGFTGLAIGWAKGHHAGWREAEDEYARPGR